MIPLSIFTNLGEFKLNIIGRKEAKEKGLTKYFTGESCKHGHVCERYLGNYQCVKCASIRALNYNRKIGYKHQYKQHRKPGILEKKRENAQKWRDKNPKKAKETSRNGQSKYMSTPHGQLRGRIKATIGKLLRNRDSVECLYLLAYTPQEFNKSLLKYTPQFMTIQEARDSGYQIDHIVPIKYISEHISNNELSFIVARDLQNLRIITQEANFRKKDKVDSKEVQEKIIYLWRKYSISK